MVRIYLKESYCDVGSSVHDHYSHHSRKNLI
nr:MAG TPA: hypothetical protein [Caudoviricetes sp.]